jgi:glycosyltransferase involved in cell wall biosynthesis
VTLVSPLLQTEAVGVVLPVHNEQELLEASLRSLAGAFGQLREWELEAKLVVVLDSCTDASEDVAREFAVTCARGPRAMELSVVTCRAKNVGYARGLGCSLLLSKWSHVDPSKIWIATTDADSTVPLNWLTTQVLQHEVGAEHWSGRVKVTDWSEHRRETRRRWQREYEQESRPIHGASLGFNGAAYLAAGGFKALKSGEDRALHRALLDQGKRGYYDSVTRVVTSGRRQARAPYGFAHALDLISSSLRLRGSN